MMAISASNDASITSNYVLQFLDGSMAGGACLTNNSGLEFYDTSMAGQRQHHQWEAGAVAVLGSSGPGNNGQLSAGSIAGWGILSRRQAIDGRRQQI